MLSDDKDLLSRISEGNKTAFSVLLNRYQAQVYTNALKIIKSHELAEEIVFTVFLKIWQHEHLNQIDSFGAYLRVTTRNQTLKVWRSLQIEERRNLYLQVHHKLEDRNTEDSILFNETSRLLDEAVRKLSPQQEAVYQLCHVEGKKYEEAAAHLSLSKLTVKTHMQLALRFIRKYMKAHTEIALALLYSHFIFF